MNTEGSGGRSSKSTASEHLRQFSTLTDDIEATGEIAAIMEHGKPAARLSAVRSEDMAEARHAVARLLIDRLERETADPRDPSWSELKSETNADRP